MERDGNAFWCPSNSNVSLGLGTTGLACCDFALPSCKVASALISLACFLFAGKKKKEQGKSSNIT